MGRTKPEYRGKFTDDATFQFEILEPKDELVKASIDLGPKMWGIKNEKAIAQVHTVLSSIRTLTQILSHTPDTDDETVDEEVLYWSAVTAPTRLYKAGETIARRRLYTGLFSPGAQTALSQLASEGDPFVESVNHAEEWRIENKHCIPKINQIIGMSAIELFLLGTRKTEIDRILGL